MGSNPTESSCWALMPQVCSDLPRNREQPGAAYGSLALKACYFLVRKHGDRLPILILIQPKDSWSTARFYFVIIIISFLMVFMLLTVSVCCYHCYYCYYYEFIAEFIFTSRHFEMKFWGFYSVTLLRNHSAIIIHTCPIFLC